MSLKSKYTPTQPAHPTSSGSATPRRRVFSSRPVEERESPNSRAVANHIARMIRRISLDSKGMDQAMYSSKRSIHLPQVEPRETVSLVRSRSSSQSTITGKRTTPGSSVETICSKASSMHGLDERIHVRLGRNSTSNHQTHPEIIELLKKGPRDLDTDMGSFSDNYFVGLTNLGNTCFMNSILQCLLSLRPLVTIFNSTRIEKSKGVAYAFCYFLNEYFSRQTGSRSPGKVKQAIQQRATQFQGYGQHDSQEFLRAILVELHNDLNKVKEIPRFTYSESDYEKLCDSDKAKVSWNRYKRYDDSQIVDLFGGQLESIVTCQSCHYKSITYETFLDLSIPVTSHVGSLFSSLDSCLEAYFKEELLEEPYKCERCKLNRSATKKLFISRYPPILVLHLKRFKTENGYGMTRKLSHPIEFPIEKLHLMKYESVVCEKTEVYSLTSISNHYGNTGGGHYTASTRNWVGNGFADRNDSHVTPVSVQEACDSKSAYILFYERHINK